MSDRRASTIGPVCSLFALASWMQDAQGRTSDDVLFGSRLPDALARLACKCALDCSVHRDSKKNSFMLSPSAFAALFRRVLFDDESTEGAIHPSIAVVLGLPDMVLRHVVYDIRTGRYDVAPEYAELVRVALIEGPELRLDGDLDL